MNALCVQLRGRRKMFIYNKDKDIFIHMASTFIFDGDYVALAHNDEMRNKFYNITGTVLDDYSIGMMRAKRNEQTVYS
jgi:hypothetical protein